MPETKASRFNKYSSTWFKFEQVGDRVAGTLVSVEEGVGQDGGAYPILNLDTNEGDRRVRASQYQLKELLDRENPEDGDFLEIELIGFTSVAMGKMKDFVLKVTKNDGESF
jgi:hypothetical protein